MRKRVVSELGFVEPQLPTLIERPPEGEEWIHEIKFDGYRSQIVIDQGRIRIFTRRGHDWTSNYKLIAKAAAGLGIERAIIDGEIIVADSHGKPRFGELRSAITAQPDRLIFMAFDLLHYAGHDLRGLALEERRSVLGELVPNTGRIQFSEELEGDPQEIFKGVEGAGLEGMVSKKLGSRYRSGKTKTWLKAKCYSEDVFDVFGMMREPGKPTMALMSSKGRYVGGAFVTLPQIRERLWARVQAKGKPPEGFKPKPGVQWIKPTRSAAKFLRGEEKLRHATVTKIVEEDGGSGPKKEPDR